jgi:hypothetical protein
LHRNLRPSPRAARRSQAQPLSLVESCGQHLRRPKAKEAHLSPHSAVFTGSFFPLSTHEIPKPPSSSQRSTGTRYATEQSTGGAPQRSHDNVAARARTGGAGAQLVSRPYITPVCWRAAPVLYTLPRGQPSTPRTMKCVHYCSSHRGQRSGRPSSRIRRSHVAQLGQLCPGSGCVRRSTCGRTPHFHQSE